MQTFGFGPFVVLVWSLRGRWQLAPSGPFWVSAAGRRSIIFYFICPIQPKERGMAGPTNVI